MRRIVYLDSAVKPHYDNIKNQMTNYEKVREFHKKYKRPLDQGMVPPSQAVFRLSLIEEELGELKKAVADGDPVKILDGITDVLYATYGTGAEYGFDMDEAFARVHASNMTKTRTPGIGKLFKGPDYKPANLADLAQKIKQ